MANQEHLKIIRQGVKFWNEWREENPAVRPDLREANLDEANLNEVNLRKSDLRGISLSGASLIKADLCEVNLFGANLSNYIIYIDGMIDWVSTTDLTAANLSNSDLHNSILSGANLSFANLNKANLSRADLGDANLSGADLSEAMLFGTMLSRTMLSNSNLVNATLMDTAFSSQNLSEANGLIECRHDGPSILSSSALRQSPGLPLEFLKGCGLSDLEIKYYQLYNESLSQNKITEIGYDIIRLRAEAPIQYQSTFISYSSKNKDFANKLHNKLQGAGVRCWFAPEDMKMGAKIRDELHRGIRLHERLIIILSEHSIRSHWVEDEVNMALRKERKTDELVLFPIRLDREVFDTHQAWAETLTSRNIGDFSNWDNDEAFDKAFNKLLTALRNAEQKVPEPV
jgi:hypothetical protein